MSRMLSATLLTLTLSIVATGLPARSNAQELGTPPSKNDQASDGQRIFATTCAACHGLDARGSEHAPDIAGKRDAQQLTGEELLHIIQNGIPGTGMPAFRALNTAQVHAVIRYLRTLQGEGTAAQLPGDPRRGKILFFGQAGCARCHMANGQEASSPRTSRATAVHARRQIFVTRLPIRVRVSILEVIPSPWSRRAG